MDTVIRAKFIKGLFKPLEKIEIPEGKEVLISVKEQLPKKMTVRAALKSTAGSWKGLVDTERMKEDIYNDRLITTRPEAKL